MSLTIKQTLALHRRGVFPNNNGHRSHVVTLQGLAWVAICARAKRNAGARVVMGDPLLAAVAHMPKVGARELVVQAVKLQPYAEIFYFQLIAYVGKTPPPVPWGIFTGKTFPDMIEIDTDQGCPFSVLDGHPVWLRIDQQDKDKLIAGEALRFGLVETPTD